MRRVRPSLRLAVSLGAVGILVAAVFSTATGASTASSPQVPWSLILPGSRVPQGNDLKAVVTGPAHAGFSIDVNALPWNASAPVFAASGETGNATPCLFTVCAVASTNVSIPTYQLPTEEFQMTLSSAAGVENVTYFFVVSALNSTWVNDTLEQALVQLQIDSSNLLLTREQEASDRATIEFQGGVILGLASLSAACLVVCLAVWYRSLPPGAPERARSKAARMIGWLYWCFHTHDKAWVAKGIGERPRLAPYVPSESDRVSIEEVLGP